MVNKRIVNVVAALVVLILGIGGYKFVQNLSRSMSPKPSLEDSNTIKSVFNKLGNVECNYTDEEGRNTKAYIKNGKVRAEITSSKKDEDASVIVTEESVYMWGAQGAFKINFNDEIVRRAQEQYAGQKSQIMEEIEKYKQYCKDANPSDSLFTPPSNIEFKGISDLTKPS